MMTIEKQNENRTELILHSQSEIVRSASSQTPLIKNEPVYIYPEVTKHAIFYFATSNIVFI
mgnify:FL=1